MSGEDLSFHGRAQDNAFDDCQEQSWPMIYAIRYKIESVNCFSIIYHEFV